ncbi:NEDD8 ultimate buster 1 [Nymphon striatum]|nr:NEDD8 ultimate buster 1 [Nymphon striatum]
MSKERNTSSLRRLLNRDSIKLWLEPYTQEKSSVGNYPQDFIEKYSTELKLQLSDVKDILEQLRNNAITKLSSKKKFKETGIATLKLKIAQNQSGNYLEVIPYQYEPVLQAGTANHTVESSSLEDSRGDSNEGERNERMENITELSVSSVESSLTVTGCDLKTKIASLCHINPISLKLISCGAVLKDEKTLEAQKIENNYTLLVLVINESKEEVSEKEKEHLRQIEEIQNIKKDVGLVLDSKNDYSKLEFADQNGKVINIPVEEKQALGTAMTFNEKGRTYMKKKDYANALIFLLEADKEFMSVRQDIISMTDNYPIVCLDIVWCYLCLSSVSDLHDAEKRLLICEQFLNQSYGKNQDRLMKIKGSSGCESALYARLHLLQGVLAFHQNRLADAENFLKQAENEISSLKVDDDKICEILALGYTAKEARLSLRHCYNNVSTAVSHIINKREEKQKRISEEKERRKEEKASIKLGKTANGEAVSHELFKCMLKMGFSSKAAICALQKANNSVSLAIELLHENPKLAGDQHEVPENLDQMVINLCDMFGLDYNAAMSALESNNMNFELVRSLLLNTDNARSGPSTSNTRTDFPSENEAPEASTSDLANFNDFQAEEAAARLSSEIKFDEEDYLDLGLHEESEYLQQYLALLNDAKSK